MADKDTVWTAVVAAYPEATLKPLTNIQDRSASAIDTTVGTSAAEHVLGLWPHYAEIAFDVADAGHMAAAIKWTVAVLMERSGTNAETASKELERITGDSGVLAKLRRTTSRAHVMPYTTGPNLNAAGQRLRPYSHRNSMPKGFMPSDQVEGPFD